jgi:PPP family 3-phenylpropionic acid transporter
MTPLQNIDFWNRLKCHVLSGITAHNAIRIGVSDAAGEPRAKSPYFTLSSMEFLYWFASAAGSYLTVFLIKRGVRPDEVGFLNGVTSVVAILAIPFWGMIADKVQSVRRIFIFCMSVGIILWGIIPPLAGIRIGVLPLIYIIAAIGSFFRVPANSLFDAFVVQRSDLDRVAYGNVRLWGSFSFAVMSIALSVILPQIGVDITFYVYGLAFIPLLIIMCRIKNGDTGVRGGRKSFRQMGFGRLFKNYYFVTYLIFTVFLMLPINTSGAFLPYLLEGVGGDTARLGLVIGYKALLEIPTLLLMKPLRRRFPLPVAILCSGLLYCLEALFYSRANSFAQIVVLQTIEGLGSGLMIGAAASYVYSLAPEGLASTAMTLNGTASTIAAIIGNVFGGMLIMTVGIRTFYLIIALMIFLALVYFLASLVFGVRVMKKMMPLSR